MWCRGDVDLNRDFPDPLLLGSTGLRPTGDEQPETLALMTWTSQTHFVASASMHEVGSHFMPCVQPHGCCISQHVVRDPSLCCGRGLGRLYLLADWLKHHVDPHCISSLLSLNRASSICSISLVLELPASLTLLCTALWTQHAQHHTACAMQPCAQYCCRVPCASFCFHLFKLCIERSSCTGCTQTANNLLVHLPHACQVSTPFTQNNSI